MANTENNISGINALNITSSDACDQTNYNTTSISSGAERAALSSPRRVL